MGSLVLLIHSVGGSLSFSTYRLLVKEVGWAAKTAQSYKELDIFHWVHSLIFFTHRLYGLPLRLDSHLFTAYIATESQLFAEAGSLKRGRGPALFERGK